MSKFNFNFNFTETFTEMLADTNLANTNSEPEAPNMTGGFLQIINAARNRQLGSSINGTSRDKYGLPLKLDNISYDEGTLDTDTTPVLKYLLSGGASIGSNINLSKISGGGHTSSANGDDYKNKYLKYKAMYLNMKQSKSK